MQGPVAALLDGGARLHLQHGPIDLIIGADDPGRDRAFAAAAARFDGMLEGLVSELPAHRAPLLPDTPEPADPVARRMYRAARPFCDRAFLTPMIAVAGAVADAVLAAMIAAGPLRRAYVNNGGDIALHLDGAAEFSIAMADLRGTDLGRIRLDAADGIGGVATSGAGGRSLSLGIADSVTVLARDAATADVAATLIGNAVDLPDHPGIRRMPARDLQPDSDLGNRPVVTSVPRLTDGACDGALRAGRLCADEMITSGLIKGAALFLQGRWVCAGTVAAGIRATRMEIAHAKA
ncbi:UPF0280 family protein [Paracoccus sp. (in: a-proteobacteria)]|uniref:UPF0280 family protein n=1 Tax=Paracoccus sp. TaxID=267 RepID=UPI003A844AD4